MFHFYEALAHAGRGMRFTPTKELGLFPVLYHVIEGQAPSHLLITGAMSYPSP